MNGGGGEMEVRCLAGGLQQDYVRYGQSSLSPPLVSPPRDGSRNATAQLTGFKNSVLTPVNA